MLFVQLLSAAACAHAAVYPVTDSMRKGAAAIINNLLPSTGVTQASSNAWNRLAYITDTFGPRISGSQPLEDTFDWIIATAKADGLTVSEIPAMIPRWVRGNESCYMMTPRVKKLHFVGLGMSIGTGGQDLTAQVLVVEGTTPADAYTNLQGNCTAARGKIVLFNVPFTEYGSTVGVRSSAATWAVSCGAVAALIRTIGPFSLQNPHTGVSSFFICTQL